MKYPDIWGKGALFCYSGYDGECTFDKSICATYSGDRMGVMLDKGKSELYFELTNVKSLEYTIVAHDIMIAKLNDEFTISMMFADENTIVGNFAAGLAEPVLHGDSENYYFCKINDTFIFTTDKNKLEKNFDIKALSEKYLAFYDNIKAPNGLSEDLEKTLVKCFSVLKSQVYSADGVFCQRWTTPDKLPHRYLWLWDSVFHTFGNVFMDEELAYDSLASVMDGQTPDGLIPHLVAVDWHSEITQPPVLAWGFLELYKKTKNEKALKNHFEGLKSYLKWNKNNRDSNNNDLYEWFINTDDPNCRCDECGMDNSPRFDDVKPMDCIDFSCFMANEMRCMAKICEIIKKPDEKTYFETEYEKIKKAINDNLYCENDGMYYDKVICDGKLKKVKAVSSLLPLFAGVCDEIQAKRLAENYKKEFECAAGVASVAKSDKTYGTDMWRGPVWINYNYMIMQGLLEYGYKEEALDIAKKTIDIISHSYNMFGTVYEFYDSDNKTIPSRLYRKGTAIHPYNMNIRMQSIPDYGWTASIFVKLIYDFFKTED